MEAQTTITTGVKVEDIRATLLRAWAAATVIIIIVSPDLDQLSPLLPVELEVLLQEPLR